MRYFLFFVFVIGVIFDTHSQDSIKTKRKWIPSVKIPFKGKKEQNEGAEKKSPFSFLKKDKSDTTDKKLSLSRIFGRAKNEIEALKPHETFSLGIGMIQDSATNLTESFEVFRFFEENPIVLDGKRVPVKLVSHPTQATLVVTGNITHYHINICKGASSDANCDQYVTISNFQVWQNGNLADQVSDKQVTDPRNREVYKVKEEISTDYPLYDGTFRVIRFGLDKLYRSLYRLTGQDESKLPVDPSVEKVVDCSELNEFKYRFSKRNMMESRSLTELMPGYVNNYTPAFDTAKASFIVSENFTFLKQSDYKDLGIDPGNPVDLALLTNMIYRYVDKNEFRVLNSSFVPDKFKTEIAGAIAPKSTWIGAAICYWAAGNEFLNKGDWAAAELAYEACIFLSSTLNSSAQVKHEVRLMALRGLHEVAKSQGRKVSGQFLSLTISLIEQYLKSNTANQREEEYRNDIDQYTEVCAMIDDKVAEIKKQNVGQKFIAALEVMSDALLDDGSSEIAGARFQKSTESLNKARRAMNAQLAKVDLKDKISQTLDANSIKKAEYGAVYWSRIVWDFINEEEIRKSVMSALTSFAADKPITMQLVKNLSKSTPATYEDNARKLTKKLIEIEKEILRYEKQNQQVKTSF